MATATSPYTKAQQSNHDKLSTNEFDGMYDVQNNGLESAASAAQSSNSWDEKIVPALKRRLEADQDVLQNRMNGYDFEKATSVRQQQASKPRPIPRRNGHDEIIQDGLGDDELIPSEWATGSKARFLTTTNGTSNITSRSASENYTMARSTSGSEIYHNAYEHQSNFHTPPNSPPSQDEIISHTNSTILTARDRARRLARERQRATEAYGDQGLDEEGHEGMWNATNDENEQSRLRTKSTPGLLKRYTDDGKREETGVLKEVRNQSSQRSLRSAASPIDAQNTSNSKIPLPISGSMNRVAANSPRSHRGKFESGNRENEVPGPPIESPSPDGVNDSYVNSPNRSIRSTSIVKKRTLPSTSPKSPARKAMQYSPPTQDVLDEFGPLGGTPRRTMDISVGGVGEFGDISRASSNPWDEELLPTVKRRMLQEAMMKDPRMSEVDGLIDAWDRNGVPISTKSMNSLASRTGKAGNNSTAGEGLAGAAQIDTDKADEQDEEIREDLSTNDEAQSERMKRLTDQLDLGFRSNVANAPSTEEGMEMKNLRGNQRDYSNWKMKDQSGLNKKASLPTLTTTQQLSQPAKTVKGSIAKDDEQGAGCCQCTVM